MKTEKRHNLDRVIGISVFSALAFIIALVCNIIPPVAGFLSIDAKDAVISIAAFIYGPVSGVVIALIAALVEFVTFSTTGWYGLIMNFASSAVFALSAALIYKAKRTVNGALIGFLVAVTATTGVMLLLNNFVTPLYLQYMVGLPKEAAVQTVVGYLPAVLLPFNAAKSLMNASFAMLLYKPVLLALSRAHLLRGKKPNFAFNKNSVIILTVGGVCLLSSLFAFLMLYIYN